MVMLLHLIGFPLFLLIIISLGELFSNILSKTMQLNHALTDNFGLKGILGLFFLGMLGVIFHFFLPLTSLIFRCTVIVCIVAGCFILIKTRCSVTKLDIVSGVVISTILAPLAGSMGPGYDGGLYHLPHQLWLRNESIVIGLANLHGRFGFNSLYEYISASLWVKEQFLLLSYLQLSFVVYFLLFLIKQTRLTSNTHLALLFGITINLALFNKYINTAYTYTDLPAGFVFAITFIYGHWLLYKDQPVLRGEWTIFSILLLSAIFYKISTALLLIWFVFVIFYRICMKNDSVRECLLGGAIPAGFFLIWLLRNVATTGCLLYPESASCLDVPWSAKSHAANNAKWVTAWARHPGSGLSSLQDSSWFLNWWLPNHHIFIKKLVSTGLFIGFLYGGIALRARFAIIKILDMRFIAATGFVLGAFMFWFWKAPTPRFGIGVFILFFPVLFLFLHGKTTEASENIKKYMQAIVIVGVVIFICRFGVPWKILSLDNALTINRLTVGKPKVKSDSVYGFRPIKGDQCWLIPECSPEWDRPPKSSWLGKNIFYSN